MAKEVFPSKEIPHIWFHQTQEHGRGSASISFRGDTIYSYNAPIARHATNEHGEKAVLFTTKDYSVTTTKHKGWVSNAIPTGVPVFHVPLERFEVQISVESYLYRAEGLSGKAKRARTNRLDYLSQLQDLVTEANAFCVFYGVPGVFNERDLSAARGTVEKFRAEAEKEEAKRQKTLEAKNTKNIKRWVNGEDDYFPSGVSRVYLRVIDGEVETSMGARFPVAHARKALRLIEKARKTGESFVPNEQTIHLGNYTIDEIEITGNVRAGCHYVLYDEINRIAEQLKEEGA